MNCYECQAQGRTTTAVAVCSRCHVGLCPEHLRMETEIVSEPRGMGQVSQKPEARRALCEVCQRAEG
ncbi:MAG TPA: DUF2180 family protein [Streptomyces sp.]|uniref:DUF2180 family protein n=1 Tax=Streptomyces sp. TaxID=1931 RepID=UPI002D6D4229|nr:DUF2180 family protein [Streptomyces sp.]HZG04041.1 DUF2180 family protein [Streptomyces sp.]